MALCFQQQSNTEEESSSIIFNSDSHSHEDSTNTSSSSLHYSPHLSHCNEHTLNLCVHNLSYTCHPTSSILLHKPKPICILGSVSFTAKSSEILAVVGPSGAGKSTLLGVISGRASSIEKFDAKTISINDRFVGEPAQLRKICGFVQQEDSLLPMLTVKETLMFGAVFSHSGGRTSSKEREAKVESLMRELRLVDVADTYVGDEEKRGISGGERKRVSIGLEMINDPRILVLDEPTSGLDSTCALQVTELLSAMAIEKQRTIILSIHQPSYRILKYVSNFLILSRGSAVHHGSLESLEERITTKLGMKVPLGLNTLEFAMEIIQNLEEANRNNSDHPEPHHTTISDARQFPHLSSTRKASNFFEIAYLCSRFWKVVYRTRQLLFARTMQALVGGFGLGSVYVKVSNDQVGVAERLGLFAFSLSFLLSSTVEALPIFLQERAVLIKEASRGSYRISSYMISNTLIFAPFLLAVAVIFSVPVYWIVGLNPTLGTFAFFALVVWQILLMASSLVMFLSAVAPDLISGNSLNHMVLGAFFLFSGYFIPKDSIPKYWLFMYYVSLYRYPLDSLLTNEYWSLRDECFAWSGGGGVGGGKSTCVLTGNDVLEGRGLDDDPRWVNAAIMFGFFVLYRVLCWIVLCRSASRTTL